jgi:hypothetical protein
MKKGSREKRVGERGERREKAILLLLRKFDKPKTLLLADKGIYRVSTSSILHHENPKPTQYGGR